MDPLAVFDGLSVCSACGCIQQVGSSRCPECGTFHTTVHLEERAQPIRTEEPVKPIDPSMYSLNPNSEIPQIENEEIEDMTTKWRGGISDFHIADDSEVSSKLLEVELPPVEVLIEEE